MAVEAQARDPTTLPTLEPRRAEPRGEIRRAALLDALETLLRERPLHEVSIGQIATKAGVKRSAFYFYFPSKEAAVTELLRDVFAEMISGAQGWIEGEGDPRDSLRTALEGTIRLWRAHRHLILAMLDARDDPAVRELWDSWIEMFVVPLAQAVERDRARERAATDGPPPATLIRLLLGMNERALEHHVRRGEDEAQAAELATALTQTWLRAIYGTTAA